MENQASLRELNDRVYRLLQRTGAEGGDFACESAFALPPEERRDVQRRGRFELGAGSPVVGGRDR